MPKVAGFLRRNDKAFVLKYVQTTTLGLMDGSVSKLAPLFAAAFAAPDLAFTIGLAAAVGAAISMGFSEGLSDDGSLPVAGIPS